MNKGRWTASPAPLGGNGRADAHAAGRDRPRARSCRTTRPSFPSWGTAPTDWGSSSPPIAATARLAQRQHRRLQPALRVPAAREARRAGADQPLRQPPGADLRHPQRLRPPARARSGQLGRTVQDARPRKPSARAAAARRKAEAERQSGTQSLAWPGRRTPAPTHTRPTARWTIGPRGRLRLHWRDGSAPLQHYHYDVLQTGDDDAGDNNAVPKIRVTFLYDAEGNVDRLTMPLEPGSPTSSSPARLGRGPTRIRRRTTSDPAGPDRGRHRKQLVPGRCGHPRRHDRTGRARRDTSRRGHADDRRPRAGRRAGIY